MHIYHNSQDIRCRRPFGAAAVLSCVDLNIECEEALEVTLRLWQDDSGQKLMPMTAEGKWFRTKITLPSEGCVIWYYFILRCGDGRVFYYGNNPENLGGMGIAYDHEPPSFQITVYKPAPVADWYKNALVYQIFPDRFWRGKDWAERVALSVRSQDRKGPRRLLHQDWNDAPFYTKNAKGEITRWSFFGGTISGVKEKLPYLRSLGVTAIYFNPIFEAASNHRYDTANYMKIDPMLGDEEIFRSFCTECDKNGISVILDGVFSHTGADSVYFDRYGNYGGGAYSDRNSQFRDWYTFTPGEKNEYECWWGVEDLPNVREMNESYKEFICGKDGVIRHWMRSGARGWRLDVADELPDQFIEELRKSVKNERGDGVLIGEVWEDASHKKSYGRLREYFLGDELDGTMNYPLRRILLDYVLGADDAQLTGRRILSLVENYPRENLYAALNIIGGHDRARILTVLSGVDEPETDLEREEFRLNEEQRYRAKQRLKLLSVLQYTLPGVPCIYYGDEAGLEGSVDPYNRGTYPWGHEDQELLYHFRMLGLIYKNHDALKQGGFSVAGYEVLEQGGLSISGHAEIYGELNASGTAEMNGELNASDNARTQEDHSAFIHSENCADSVRLTTTDQKDATEQDILAYVRTGEQESIAVAVNRNLNQERTICIHTGSYHYALELLTSREYACTDQHITITVPACGAVLVLLRKEKPVQKNLPRSAGVICHLGSLQDSRAFVNFLSRAKIGLWQLLPVNPPGLGNSPYLSPCVFAGDLSLFRNGKKAEGGTEFSDTVPAIPGVKDSICVKRIRQEKEQDTPDYKRFLLENAFWLEDYALYTALSRYFETGTWQKWPEDARNRTNLEPYQNLLQDEIEAIKQEQYLFDTEWSHLRACANAAGIQLIGDLPFYVAPDGADTWANKTLFQLDDEGHVFRRAGVPPDYFAKEGQDWGNPVYNWAEMRKDDYLWWRRRLAQCAKRYDYLRLDHFRAFSSFYAIPQGESALHGEWQPGEGERFFNAVRSSIGTMGIIAEDLGHLDEDVENLLKLTGFYGMNVWQFSHEEMRRMSDTGQSGRIFYTGTHDNQTLVGWCESQRTGRPSEEENDDPKERAMEIIEEIYSGNSPWAMMQLQDLLLLPDEARMNVPGTPDGNWKWKVDEFLLDGRTAEKYAALAKKYDRA